MKKFVLYIFAALSVFITAAPLCAADTSKEPTGFRGIQWDTPVTEYQNTFRLADDNIALPDRAGQKKYEKVEEKKSFAGHEADEVAYYFDSAGFVKAQLSVSAASGRGLPVCEDFVKACSLQWGEGEEVQDLQNVHIFPKPDKMYTWKFSDSQASVMHFSDRWGDQITLRFLSNAGMARESVEGKKIREADFGHGESKEPTGFRGIQWDTPIAEYPDMFRLAEDNHLVPGPAGQTKYEKIEEKGTFAGHETAEISYYFDRVGFAAATVRVNVESDTGLSIYRDFVKACNLRWGEGKEPSDTVYIWEFPDSRASVDYSNGGGRGDWIALHLESRAAIEREAEERQKAESEREKEHEEKLKSESKTDF